MFTIKVKAWPIFLTSFLFFGSTLQTQATPILSSWGKSISRTQARLRSSFTVTRGDDRNAACLAGDCSLREAINAANASVTDDTINFAPGLTTITLTNQIVINNVGALTITGPGANDLTIDGGAGTNRIFVLQQAIVTMSGLTLTGGNGDGGVAAGGAGGAMIVFGGSTVLDGVQVTGNTASGYGGALNYQGGTHRITNSTISANTAGSCGGFYLEGALTIVNSTISGNSSTAEGGGFCCEGDATLRHVTVTNNSAYIGGGISNGLTIYLANTIVAGNTATSGNPPEIATDYAGITSMGGNLIGSAPGSSPTPSAYVVYQPTDLRDVDPRLGPLQNNGGPTPTHALLAASPAIDKGLNVMAVDPANGNALAFDQRGTGFPRISDGNGDSTATVDIGAYESATISASNLEELYAAVNNPQNAGLQVVVAPGVYVLSVNDPMGIPRPNGGRLELQANMALTGTIGDRTAVVIDAINLPPTSYNSTVVNTGAIRLGHGTNALEWLTITNAVNGGAGIIVHLDAPGTTNVRIAHTASIGNSRGLDLRNTNATSTAYLIDADIVDNDLADSTAEGLRIVNLLDQTGGAITARLNSNRSHGNRDGMLLVNNRSNISIITVTSSGDRFYENADGTVILGGLSQGSTTQSASGNTVSFIAVGTHFENNNGSSPLDLGGLIISGGDNPTNQDLTSNNTVHVELKACRLAFNQVHDLAVFGARFLPGGTGTPGTNNHVDVTLLGVDRKFVVEEFTDCFPAFPGGNNNVTVTRWPKY